MKIMLLIGDITLGGGAERVVINLANAFNQTHHQCQILSFYKENKNIAYTLNPNIKVEFLHQKSQKQMKKNIFYKLFYKYYESFILKQKYKDIDLMIYNNCSHFPFFKNPHTHYINLIHLNFKKYRKRNDYFDSLIILSSKQINQWKAHHKNIQVIPNFIPFISDKISDYQQKNILSIGRMIKEDQKGFLRLIEIWKLLHQKHKDWTLTLVGEGEAKNTIKEKIKENQLENSIILKPFTQEIEKEYLSASIYVMCSYFEGFGMVLVESANYNIPSIAFDINTGPSDIIEHGKSGFLIQNSDLNDFAQKLGILMDDEKLRKTMGEKAKEKVKKAFYKDIIMKKWEKTITTLNTF
ncbi:glycosyltransferase family 4 protein [Campylobacter sp. VicNov18]|uniref:glycosyltransferase family 4 protein n=1 Tax=Campylobacter bilis TaxID=2691918 RepID=UPI001E2F01FF|nr:glycosyltransferase family 4 protein [Campylobacter bilis]MCC8356195.1 glycosyltransferase family 4 protein [Campylobacter bilis]